MSEPTDWMAALRDQVARTSQARVAQRIGTAESTVSQVLSGTYRANPVRIARRVRGVLLGETVECPVALEMPLDVCQGIQDRKEGQHGNPLYRRAWLCCRGRGEFVNAGPCPHYCGAGAAS